MSRDFLHQLGALTGLGWTTSLLGYLSTMLGYLPRVVGEPHTLLYTSVALLLATLGIDKAADSRLLRAGRRRLPWRRDEVLSEQR